MPVTFMSGGMGKTDDKRVAPPIADPTALAGATDSFRASWGSVVSTMRAQLEDNHTRLSALEARVAMLELEKATDRQASHDHTRRDHAWRELQKFFKAEPH
jgi:hypothetical protein